jgi:UDP-N-acetylglucosamine 2-epimerase
MKLAIVVGTRPEIIRLASIINKAREIFEVTLIHTGQNYDYNLNDVFFKDLSIGNPDIYLDCSRDNIGKTIGDIIAKTYEIFSELKPDAILVDGDTNSCLSVYSAKRLKIPIFHFEAGHRCFDINLPEEINRKLVDHLADVNLCYTEHARRNLLNENCATQYTFVVGSPIREVLNSIKDKILESDALVKYGLEKGKYFVWSSHREENITQDKNFDEMIHSLNTLAETYDMPIFFPAHPRTSKKINEKNVQLNKKIIISEPIGIIEFCNLQMNSLCVISDSGTLTEETDILGFKGIMLRTSTEKPEGIEAGTITVGNIKWDTLKDVIKLVISSPINANEHIPEYLPEHVSDKVCKIIIGYTSIVNKFIWMK